MFTIHEWRKRYEVSLKGREPKEDEELRVGPLAFVRLKVYGHRQGAGYRRLQQVCGERFMEVFGTFCKFLEISGNQPRDKRGSLLNEKDEPATVADLAFLVGISNEQVLFALQKLCEIGWVKSDNTTELNSTQLNTIKHKGPEISGKPGKPTTEAKNADRRPGKSGKAKYLDNVFLTESEHSKLLERFGENETAIWIEKLDSGIGSKGYKYKSHYKTIINWSLNENDNRTNPIQQVHSSEPFIR